MAGAEPNPDFHNIHGLHHHCSAPQYPQITLSGRLEEEQEEEEGTVLLVRGWKAEEPMGAEKAEDELRGRAPEGRAEEAETEEGARSPRLPREPALARGAAAVLVMGRRRRVRDQLWGKSGDFGPERSTKRQ